tara:strand:+ start:1605 stop:2435 length:831 start_codon:yes stop_codon:yes gene_type:complete
MWFNILKDKWAMFTKNILKDKWPTNRKKYVKFSNLDDINQRMVKFYLEKGKHKPQHRKVYVKQILVEMEKSSNARFDLEKFDEPLSFQGWEQITNDNNPFKAKHPDRTGFEYSLLHRELKVFVGSHFLGSIKNRGGFGRYGDIKSVITRIRSEGLPEGTYYARASPTGNHAIIFEIKPVKGKNYIYFFGYQDPKKQTPSGQTTKEQVIDLWNTGTDKDWFKNVYTMLDTKHFMQRDTPKQPSTGTQPVRRGRRGKGGRRRSTIDQSKLDRDDRRYM